MLSLDTSGLAPHFEFIDSMITKLQTGNVGNDAEITKDVHDGIEFAFEAQGVSRLGGVGVWPPNRGRYAEWKLKKVGHLDPLVLTGLLKKAATNSKLDKKANRSSIVWTWTWERPKRMPDGRSVDLAAIYQSNPEYQIVLTDRYIEDIILQYDILNDLVGE